MLHIHQNLSFAGILVKAHGDILVLVNNHFQWGEYCVSGYATYPISFSTSPYVVLYIRSFTGVHFTPGNLNSSDATKSEYLITRIQGVANTTKVLLEFSRSNKLTTDGGTLLAIGI